MIKPQVFVVLLGSLFISNASAQRGCAANNCNRAVSSVNSRFGTATNDCASFFGTTYITGTPSPTTTYVTINPTVLTTTTVYSSTWTGRSTRRAKRAGELEIRAPTPAPVPDSEGIILPRQNAGNVPSYASACRPRSQFSTACSCLGVTAGPTVTIGPSVTTFTSTVTGTTFTQTITTTVPICNPRDNYGITWEGGGANPGPGQSSVDYRVEINNSVTSPEACCSLCFSTVGCITYDLILGGCRLYSLTAGMSTVSTGTYLCPYGRVVEYTNPGSQFGIGPCNSYAGPAT